MAKNYSNWCNKSGSVSTGADWDLWCSSWRRLEPHCLPPNSNPLSEHSWQSPLAVRINIFSRDSTLGLYIKQRRGDTWECVQLYHFFSAPLACVQASVENGLPAQGKRPWIPNADLSVLGASCCFELPKRNHLTSKNVLIMWQACFVINSKHANAYCAHIAQPLKKKKRKKISFHPHYTECTTALSCNEKHVSMCKTLGREIRFMSFGDCQRHRRSFAVSICQTSLLFSRFVSVPFAAFHTLHVL